jgi:hypothetical protein
LGCAGGVGLGWVVVSSGINGMTSTFAPIDSNVHTSPDSLLLFGLLNL